jgi:hypothetical protein
MPGDTPSHHHDGPDARLSCSVGEALCAIGIVLGIVLLRRVGTRPYRVTWRLRHTGPGYRSLLAGAAPLHGPTTTGLVRLQI